MVTIREVAKEAGVSVATASRALNGLAIVTRSTREKIEAAAAKLNYVPHSGARSLTRQRTDTIGVILPDLFGEFFSEIIRGIDLVSHGAGKTLLLGNMHGSAEEAENAVRAMRGRVDGLLVMPPNLRVETICGALNEAIPTVLLNAETKDGSIPFVTVDNYAGARLVTEHLVERGARNIVHISGPRANFDARERQKGFCDVLRERFGEGEPRVIPGDFREGAGRKAARLLLDSKEKIDAVFAGNDMMAIDLMSELRDCGVIAGRDIMVAGFDDIPLARYVTPQLTTVHSDITRLGSAAAMMMLRMMRGEKLGPGDNLVIEPTLAIRGSTAEFRN
ncbi:LacI family DNA-binding transcriptional regulator [Qipengyuania atrilutea]|uniref:LacI family DNA-binding transcriptional regulator n=1 Tax=Qipengyuania atrilutea TaxID=2744473 RepID=A0A850H3J2_9SPHN|nr:LacI family DNA-binding transcriptional regulator [Actirhodobacter atriluteus]NVD45160.1 LacI family DNA-binding transcriptional regulator [Actirhodobacter atriluteus]